MRLFLLRSRLAACLLLGAALVCLGDRSARAEDDPLELTGAAGMVGLTFYDRGEWAAVRSVVENPSDSGQDAALTVSFKDAPGTYFGNRFWMPSRTRREVTTLISASPLPDGYQKQGPETRVTLSQGSRTLGSRTGVVAFREPGLRAAMLAQRDSDATARTLATALIAASGAGPTTFAITPQTAPDDPAVWAGLDLLALTGPSDELTAAQLRAIRHWVHAGGALWVMLDQTGPELPTRLLGDAWRVQPLAKTGHTRLTLVGDGVEHKVEHDYSIALVLSRAQDAEVLLAIDGHPAAVRWDVGAGRVLVTTAAPRAWLEGEDANAALASLAGFVPADGVAASRTSAKSAALQVAPLKAHAAQQVGHRVPGRAVIAGVLIVFLVGVLMIGLVLHRRGRLEWVAPAAVVLAGAAGAVLVVLGIASQRQTPRALAASVEARVPPGELAQDTAAALLVYRQPGAARADVFTYHGPPPHLEDALFGQQRRIMRLDRQRWAIENIDLAPGQVHLLPVAGMTRRSTPASVSGTLTDRGVELRWAHGSGPDLSDAILAAGRGRLGVSPTDAGSMTARYADRLTGDQYVGAAMLSQRQVERTEVYRDLLSDRPPAAPVLMGWWTPDAEAPIRIDPLDEGVTPTSQVLGVFPIEFGVPAPGRAVRVPALLLPMRPVSDRERGLSVTAFDPRVGAWIPNMTNEQTAMMGFAVAPAFRGIDVEAVALDIDLTCPGRDCAIVTYADGQVIEVEQDRGGFTGTVRLTDPVFAQQLRNGEVLLGVRVGPGPFGEALRSWTVRRFAIDIVGQAPER